jgi:hypothetical protein
MPRDFGSRIRPEEITPNIRKRLIRADFMRESRALGAVVLPVALVTLLVGIGYGWSEEPTRNMWPALGPILVTAAGILLVVHFYHRRERKFLASAPAAPAEVKEIESKSGFAFTHRLIIKYKPLPPDPKGLTLRDSDNSQLVTVSIESDLPGFHEQLHRGDFISLIYDPHKPDHVQVVEEEHRAAPAFAHSA